MTLEDHFGEDVAARYDDPRDPMFSAASVDATAAFLHELAGGGVALELGIGTGRIALPLAERGTEVHGIDLSEAMVARMRAKPGGASIPIAIGDFATTRLERRFALVYLVFNTIFNLTDQEAQVACFENAARHLDPGGAFVIEANVPNLRGLPPGEPIRVFAAGAAGFGFDEYDIATQGLVSHHLVVADGRAEVVSVPFRYAWPAELDLMARLAGLALAGRYGDWDRRAFTTESRKHVSVWRAAPGPGPSGPR